MLGRRMVAEAQLIGEHAQMNKMRVTWTESTTMVWVSNNIIAPKLSQRQAFSSYFNSPHPVAADHLSKL